MRVMLNTNRFNTYQNRSQNGPTVPQGEIKVDTKAAPSFKGGLYDKFTDKLAKKLADLTKNKNAIPFIDWMAKQDVVSTLAASTGIVISGFYMYNTAKSKKIEQEQKKPLIINMGLVTAMSTILAKFIDKTAKKKMDDLENYFVAKNTGKMNDKTLDICKKGIKPAATLLIFTSIYRYLSPIIATPLANKISNALNKNNPSEVKKAA